MLKTIENYSQMLMRIFWFTFSYCLLFATAFFWLNPQIVQPLTNLLALIGGEFSFNIGVMKVTVGSALGVVLAAFLSSLLIAFLFRTTRLHDKISNYFRIRENFDLNEILIPLAISTGVKLAVDSKETMRKARRDLMDRVFYEYASSRGAKIDEHLVLTALDSWVYFWVFIEGAAMSALAAIAFFLTKEINWASISLAIGFFSVLCSVKYYGVLPRKAHREVKAIVSNEEWVEQIKKEIDHAL